MIKWKYRVITVETNPFLSLYILSTLFVVVVVNHCFTSLSGTDGLLSDIVI